MKHKILKLIPLIGILLFYFVSGQEVKADVDYDIAKNITTAKVNSDGSLSMKRAITYKFNSSANGVYYRQNLQSNQKIDDIKVTVKDGQKRHTKLMIMILKEIKGIPF
ncbi:VCBS domain-containing protein [Lactobacillus sp. R2/2]|nr:VCBS domain-containing protein [Lactobacillus sp. R2/2]